MFRVLVEGKRAREGVLRKHLGAGMQNMLEGGSRGRGALRPERLETYCWGRGKGRSFGRAGTGRRQRVWEGQGRRGVKVSDGERGQ